MEMEKLVEQVEKQIEGIVQKGIQITDLDRLGKLVDIHKDIANECYWKAKEGALDMKYKYGTENYGARARDSRGRFTEGGEYRGEYMLNDIHDSFREYSDGKEAYMRGNYGAKGDTVQSLEFMLNGLVQFVQMLKRDAQSQDEVRLIQQYISKLSEA